jgi:hypothetical protein
MEPVGIFQLHLSEQLQALAFVAALRSSAACAALRGTSPHSFYSVPFCESGLSWTRLFTYVNLNKTITFTRCALFTAQLTFGL